MKVNEAPDKIYLQVCGDCNDNDCKNCKFEDLEDNVTWCKDKIFEKDIKYTHTDAFVEKACEYLRNTKRCVVECIGENVYKPLLSEEEILEFCKSMKGE